MSTLSAVKWRNGAGPSLLRDRAERTRLKCNTNPRGL